jgi:U6 snRNA-associated Sm-like protein LSm7
MSDRPAYRGGSRGGSRGDYSSRGGGGGRGGSRGGYAGGDRGDKGEKPKKENILDLAKYMDKQITVKFNGGREGLLLSCAPFNGWKGKKKDLTKLGLL